MANPFLSMLGLGGTPTTPTPPQGNLNGIMSNLNTVLGLYNLVKGSGHQMETLQQMAQTNPDVANTLKYIQDNGGDMNKIANDLAQKNGVSLPLIMSLFK